MTEALLTFFKALADESRLKIVGLLAKREYSVHSLAQALELTEPTISHHLAVLKSAGLVKARAEGTTRWHALDSSALEELSQRVLQRTPVASPAKEDDWDSKTLRGFVGPDGALKVIPASRRKRGAVLRWLMRDFAADRQYSEAEVNHTIQTHHWDSATLRRELIGHRMLARKDSVYWRLPQSEWKAGGEA